MNLTCPRCGTPYTGAAGPCACGYAWDAAAGPARQRVSGRGRVSQVALVVALSAFCLPWVEIRCDRPPDRLGGEPVHLLATQSGLQMVYGGATNTVNGRPAEGAAARQQFQRAAGDRATGAPLVGGFALALGLALAASLLVADRARRALMVAAASLAAVAAVLVQAALGFPLVANLPRGGGDGEWDYTPWFWLALGAAAAAGLCAAWERLAPPAPPEVPGYQTAGPPN